MKRLYKILIWILLFIWQLPQNIVAICMIPFMGKMNIKYIKRFCWCIICDNMKYRGSISLGNFVLLGSELDTTCAHELGHVVDSHWMGPLYLFIIGLPSIIWAWSDMDSKKGISYYSFYTERRANRHSHLHDYNWYKTYYRLEFDEGYNLDDIE